MFPRSQDPLRQCGGSVQAATRHASIRTVCRIGISTALFTVDKPIIFNFHGYPWLIHRLAYRRTNHKNLHVRGYKEKGNINTPLELAINNQIDRFSLAIDVIDRVPGLQVSGAHAKEKYRETCRSIAGTTPTSTASTSPKSINGPGRTKFKFRGQATQLPIS